MRGEPVVDGRRTWGGLVEKGAERETYRRGDGDGGSVHGLSEGGGQTSRMRPEERAFGRLQVEIEGMEGRGDEGKEGRHVNVGIKYKVIVVMASEHVNDMRESGKRFQSRLDEQVKKKAAKGVALTDALRRQEGVRDGTGRVVEEEGGGTAIGRRDETKERGKGWDFENRFKNVGAGTWVESITKVKLKYSITTRRRTSGRGEVGAKRVRKGIDAGRLVKTKLMTGKERTGRIRQADQSNWAKSTKQNFPNSDRPYALAWTWLGDRCEVSGTQAGMRIVIKAIQGNMIQHYLEGLQTVGEANDLVQDGRRHSRGSCRRALARLLLEDAHN